MMNNRLLLWQLAEGLLKRTGLGSRFNLFPLPGGRNNRVFRLQCAEGEFLFKQYFHSPEDPRDRLKHEYLLLEYLFTSGSTYTARPYVADPENHVALMEFIPGRRMAITEITPSHIDQAIQFFQDLNRRKLSEAGRALPLASEACFSLSQHLLITQRRIARLENISTTLPIDKEAEQFVQDSLIPLWKGIHQHIESILTTSSDISLSLSEQCISPSDFGFHNVLQKVDGSLKFIDFEYAGWDDPAKLVIDFANQPDMTLERSLSDRFRAAVINTDPEPEKLRLRVALLEPLYQVKWACICLNDFLTIGKVRRNFINEEEEENQKKSLQLQRSQKMLERAIVNSTFTGS